MARRGAQRAQQFVAHEGQVNCLKIGRQSVGVLVTGGDDAKVNLWTIGKPAAILSLSGHSTAVTSVTFDTSEQRVLAGSHGGTLKVWDIEESKVLATMSGHRTAVQVVDFHPFSSYFASGSQDTNVKLWDWRQRSCAYIFKGHKKAVNCLVYSPDGKWIVSGGDDSAVKVWDMAAGKMLHEFTLHTAPITSIQFNPCELVLASASTDKCVRFWDLETLESISVCGPETTPARAISFMPDGNCLLAAYQDGLRVYDFDPAATFDFVDAAWSRVYDLAVLTGDRRLPGCAAAQTAGDQNVLGCSLHQNSVGVWIYPVSKIRVPPPLLEYDGERPPAAPAPPSAPPSTSDRPLMSPNGGAVDPASKPGIGRSPVAVLQRVQSLPQSSPPPPAAHGRATSDGVAPPPERKPAVKARVLSSGGGHVTPRERRAAADRDRGQRQSTPSLDIGTDAPGDSLARGAPLAHDRPSTSDRSSTPGLAAPPRSANGSANGREASGEASAVAEFKAAVLAGRERFVAAVAARHSNLHLARLSWQRGDVRAVLSTLNRCGDPSVVADVLSEIGQRMDLFTLDACCDASPALEECLRSASDKHKAAALSFCLALLSCFAQVIRDVTGRAVGPVGVDLSGEERRQRCLAAKAALQELEPSLEKCLSRPGAVSQDAEQLLVQIRALS